MSGHTCYYCHLEHPRVEAGGVHFCPNAMCTGPGGAPHRRALASYTEERHERGHTVDEEEWQRAGLAHADALDATDPQLAARIRSDSLRFGEILEERRKKKE